MDFAQAGSTILFVPCFNEAGRIGRVLERARQLGPVIDELLIVDDGSTDGSLEEIRGGCGANGSILRHRHRRGLGESFRTAFRHTLGRGHANFAVLAGNGKDDPLELPTLLEPIQRDQADFVQGSRFHPQGGVSRRLPSHRGVAIRLFTWGVSRLCGRRFYDCSNGFRAYRVGILRDPRIDWAAPWLGHSYEVEIYLLLAAMRHGYRVTEVPTSKIYPDDDAPYSKAAPADWWRLIKPLVWRALGLDRVRGTRVAPGAESDPLLEVITIAES